MTLPLRHPPAGSWRRKEGVLNGAEIGQLLDAVRAIKYGAVLTTANAAGLRIGEVCTLQIADIDISSPAPVAI